jgi:flagellar biosynthesis chaperone FliJ
VEEGPLPALELLRRDAVEAARAQLAELRAQLAQQEARFTEASAARQRCEEALQGERAHFGDAGSVQRLRLVEGALRALTHELRQAQARVSAAEQACRQARAQVAEAEQALIAAEVGRRALSGLLSTRRAVAERRREREAEDQADELFQGRR